MMPGKRAVVAMALVAAAAPVAPMATASEVKKMPSIHAGMMEQPDFDAVTCFHMPTFTGEMTPYDRLERAAQKDLDRIKFQRDHNRAYKHELQAVFTQQRKHGGTWVVDEPAEIPNLELEPIGYSRQWLGEERMGGGWSSQSDPLSDEKSAHAPLSCSSPVSCRACSLYSMPTFVATPRCNCDSGSVQRPRLCDRGNANTDTHTSTYALFLLCQKYGSLLCS
jgi:hypothetical protein